MIYKSMKTAHTGMSTGTVGVPPKLWTSGRYGALWCVEAWSLR